jgi:hypothetical protein
MNQMNDMMNSFARSRSNRTGLGTGNTATGSYKFGRPNTVRNEIPSGYREGSMNQFTPEQHQLYRQQFEHVSPNSYLSRLARGEEGIFDEIEAPAMRQYQQQVGNLASRFSNYGTGGRHSSGFQNQATAGAANFAQGLQSKRQDLMRQALSDLMSYSQNLLGQRPYEQFITPKQQKESSGWGGFFGGALGGAGGFLAGGPTGALTGAKLGYDIGSGF